MNNTTKYNTDRIKLLVKGLIPSVLSIFLPKKRERIIFNSTTNTFYDFNSKYLFEYFLEHYPEYEVRFVINDHKKREKLNQLFGMENRYFIETESIRGMVYALRAYSWVCSAFETPVGGVGLRANRFVYHLGHGTHFKAIVFNENALSFIKKVYYFIIRYNFTRYLTTSQALIPTYKQAYKCDEKRLIVIGEPRNDIILSPKEEVFARAFGAKRSEETDLLYAPTWRPDSGSRLFPFDDMDWETFVSFLEEQQINIYLRMHPSFPEDLSQYTSRTHRIRVLDNDVIEDISEILGMFDMLITDYSSIYINYLLLDRPVLFLPYDLDTYQKKMGFIRPYHELTPGPKPESMAQFIENISAMKRTPSLYSDERRKVSAFFNDYTDGMLEANAQYILDTIHKHK